MLASAAFFMEAVNKNVRQLFSVPAILQKTFLFATF
jgi:hypothetical protein